MNLVINQVEVNILVRRYLDSDVSFYEEDESTDFNFMIQGPFFFIFARCLDLLEEKYPCGAPTDQCLTLKEDHLTEVHIRHLFVPEFRWLIRVDNKCLTLSIKGVDLCLFCVVEALVREVLDGAIKFICHRQIFSFLFLPVFIDDGVLLDADDSSLPDVPDEVVVRS